MYTKIHKFYIYVDKAEWGGECGLVGQARLPHHIHQPRQGGQGLPQVHNTVVVVIVIVLVVDIAVVFVVVVVVIIAVVVIVFILVVIAISVVFVEVVVFVILVVPVANSTCRNIY